MYLHVEIGHSLASENREVEAFVVLLEQSNENFAFQRFVKLPNAQVQLATP